MGTADVSLGVQKPQDKDAELARLRDENARLQAKRDLDENSAFGRLDREVALRKQREAELSETNRKLAEMQARNVKTVLTPEEIEALGETGAKGVERMIEAKMAPFSASPSAQADLTPVLSRLEALEQMNARNSQRQAYSANLNAWAASSGAPNLFARLATGGDLSEKWAAFAHQNPGAIAADASGDTEGIKAYVKLFVYENPAIAQQTATPSASGGFAPAGDSAHYGPQNWKADTDMLDARLAQGLIKGDECAKGYSEANAKLAASQGTR